MGKLLAEFRGKNGNSDRRRIRASGALLPKNFCLTVPMS